MIQGYIIAGVSALAVAGTIGGYFYGRHDGAKLEEAKHLAAAAIVREAKDAMLLVAAEKIAGIEIQHKTIRQEVQREIVEKPVYRDCVADPGVVSSINAAKTGRSEPADSGVLPGTPAPD